MDRIILDNKFSNNIINIEKDCNLLIKKDVQATNLKINIIDCKVSIIDMSDINKEYNFTNSDVNIVEILDTSNKKDILLNNQKANIEYSLIDLIDESVNYNLLINENEDNSNSKINLASICYNDKNKDYVINSSNLERATSTEITCFGMVKDASKLNYDATSFIKNGARKSVVRQNSSILLFDETSCGKNNPILVIEENDVKASHGSSIGKIDDDTLFYLCSRGLTKNEATNLICLGKIENMINKISDEEIKEKIINDFKERMINDGKQ